MMSLVMEMAVPTSETPVQDAKHADARAAEAPPVKGIAKIDPTAPMPATI